MSIKWVASTETAHILTKMTCHKVHAEQRVRLCIGLLVVVAVLVILFFSLTVSQIHQTNIYIQKADTTMVSPSDDTDFPAATMQTVNPNNRRGR